MFKLKEKLVDVKSVAILGHIRPDGDCTGSCMAVYNYIKEQMPQIDVTVYLEQLVPTFSFLKYSDEIVTNFEEDRVYDVCISLDVSDFGRMGGAVKYFETARHTLCVDHHITNPGLGNENYIVADASSTAELVYNILEEDEISKEIAEAIYLGIAHDTGVFQYSNTSEKTMQIAGKMMEKGINHSKILNDTYYKKTYMQNQILSLALLESILLLDGKVIFSRIKKREMDFYQATSKDLDGIVSQLRLTDGVEVAIFIYEIGNQEYKVSLRSEELVDVSKICAIFGGGGHVRASGCTMQGSIHDVVNNLSAEIEKQLKA